MAIKIQNLNKGLIGYKSACYSDWDPATALKKEEKNEDWSGLYVALKPEIAEGYLNDCLDKVGDGIAYLHEVFLTRDVKLAFCDDPRLGKGNISSEEKAAIVRQQLSESGVDIGKGPLIPQLGREGYFYQGYLYEENMELIVPNSLFAIVYLLKLNTYTYSSWNLKSKITEPRER